MPPPVLANINSKIYSIPILNGEMDNVAQQILQNKEEIRNLREHIISRTADLQNNNNALLLMYITLTGNFPE